MSFKKQLLVLPVLLSVGIGVSATAQTDPREIFGQAQRAQMEVRNFGRAIQAIGENNRAETSRIHRVNPAEFDPKNPDALRSEDGRAPVFITPVADAPTEFIVTLRNDGLGFTPTHSEQGKHQVRRIARQMLEGTELRVSDGESSILSGLITGFTIDGKVEDLERLSRDERVLFISPNGIVIPTGVQNNPVNWGIDRIDQRDLGLDNSFTYSDTPDPMNAYIIDSGVLSTHNEFQGTFGSRVTNVVNLAGGPAEDCRGHGTFVASQMAGDTLGVARHANIFAYKVFDCNPRSGAPSSRIINAINAVAVDFESPGVVNMSLGSGTSPSPSIDFAVQQMLNAQIPVVAAAGNGDQNGAPVNACNVSPARVPGVLTVGATDRYDAVGSFSNYGPCIDVFAPGVNLVGGNHTSNAATQTASGTSGAAPLAAGFALLRAAHSYDQRPVDIFADIVEMAADNKISGISNGSPNKLLQAYPSFANLTLANASCGTRFAPSMFGGAMLPVIKPDDLARFYTRNTSGEDRYHVRLANWNLSDWSNTDMFSDWICVGCTTPSYLDANNYLPASDGGVFPDGIYYFELAVGGQWDSEGVFFIADSTC